MPSIAEVLAQALQYHQAGNLQPAEQLYRQILQVDPRNADALHLLGELAYRAGQHDQAIDLMNQAISLNPNVFAFHCNLGVVYQAVGRLDEAANHLQRALHLTPNSPEAYNNLGVVLKDQKRYTDAEECFRRALTLRPDYADARGNLGLVFSEQDRFEEAMACFRQALQLKPNHTNTLNNMGNALLARQRLNEALACFDKALSFQPNDPITHCNRGAVLREMGRIDEAIASYQQALRLQPQFAVAHNNLGAAYKDLARWEEAVACFHQALSLKPAYPEAHLNLGSVYKEQRKFSEAETHIREALRLQPNNADAHTALGNVYVDQGMVEEARNCYKEAQRIKPATSLRIILATMLPLIYESMEHLLQTRQTFADNIQALEKEGVRLDVTQTPATPPFFLVYQGMRDLDLQLAYRRLFIAPPPPVSVSHKPSPVGADGKIRVGFISAFFKRHSVGLLMQGLIQHLSRDAFAVTVLSTANHHDSVAESIRQSGDLFFLVPPNLDTARKMIAELGLNILFYTDIGMDPFTYTLAMTRLAPIQCTTWGHPTTTGLDTMDYYVSSELFEADDADKNYCETLVRLRTIPAFSRRPVLPVQLKSREAYGLPSDCHLYSCLQSLFKFHPAFDEILGGILRADPKGVLLLSKGHYPHWHYLLQKRFSATLPDVTKRIHYVPWQFYEDFLNLNALSDVLLDPLYFGGGRTTYEAFSMGLPVVTMPSRLLPGRMAYAMYRRMGVMDCIAQTPQEYIDLALKLAGDADYRATVRGKIRAANSAIFEDMEAVRELERFFKEAMAKRGPRSQL